MKTLLASLAALLFVAHAVAADFPQGSPKFKTSLSAALSAAKKENKPVIAIFSAVWCGPCQTMKRDVYPSAAVKPYHDQFIWAYLDADTSSNQADMKKFKVNGIPHIEFLDSSGASLGQQIGSTSPDAFAGILAQTLKKAGSSK